MRATVMTSVACLLLGAATPSAMAQVHDASGGQTTLRHQVDQVHHKVADQKDKTRQLRDRVDTLQKHNREDRQRLQQSDRTIARLKRQLTALDAGDPAPSGTR